MSSCVTLLKGKFKGSLDALLGCAPRRSVHLPGAISAGVKRQAHGCVTAQTHMHFSGLKSTLCCPHPIPRSPLPARDAHW